MVLRLSITCLFLFSFIISYSQTQWNLSPYKSIGLATNDGFKIFDSNYGIQFEAIYSIKKYRIVSGVDLRIIDWGNQMSAFNFGFAADPLQ